MKVLLLVFLFILGACFGSFLCCQARRLRRKEQKKKSLGSRSVCLSCHHQLKWYDNLPIISWLTLKGKCRYCHKKIGVAELLSELGLALAFLMIGTTINIDTASYLDWTTLILVIFFTSILTFLAIYDGLYGELPTSFLNASIIIAIIILSIKLYLSISTTGFTPELIWYPLLSVTILGGIYLALYLISKGRWVGNGDWFLGTAIGVVLFHPWLALIALFLANFIACLVMYPTTKSKKNHKIHFGPFLVIAFVIAFSFAKFFLTMV